MTKTPIPQRLMLFILLLCPAMVMAAVRIDGIAGDLLANAQAHLALDDEPCDAPMWRVRRLLRQGNGEIKEAMQALGHYQASIESSLAAGDGCWEAVYTVVPGAPVTVRKLDISLIGAAADDAEFTQILANAKLQQQQPLRHDHYEALKRALLDTASRRGYADARVLRSEVNVYPQESVADVLIEMQSGERYAFGETIFRQEVLTPKLVQGFMPYRRGDPYHSGQLADFYAVLSGSGYFGRIQVEPLLDTRSNGEIPVAVTLTPGKRRLYTAGLGFSTDTGPRVRAGYTDRRVSPSGQQWSSNLVMSRVVSELSANYRRPRGDPKTDWLSFDAGFKHESTDTSESDAYQLGVHRIRQRRNNWRENRFVDLLIEDFVIGEQQRTSTLVIPGISWSRTKAENRLRPQRGLRVFLEARASGDMLGSDTNFLRLEARGKLIRKLSPRSRLLLRAESGISVTGEFSELPPSLRYFAGGDASIRGYDFESLGPRDASGQVIGGSGKVVASVEYEFTILPRWSLALFVDSGNAFEDLELQPQTGVGIGARWHSPVGPVRVDLAKPFNGADRSVRLHVSFGPDL
ncbi:MAG: outer membrane protein assembly factor [Gammaproteobacteria bacterium]|nr:outer membrane protein assembly factor [Gammaproteobacteria bacterium]NNM20159.1 outer membrane protein assembly factor [Gammaproteobacteria bacterium]